MKSEPFTSDMVRAAVQKLRDTEPLATEPRWCEPCPGHEDIHEVKAESQVSAELLALDGPEVRVIIVGTMASHCRVPRGQQFAHRMVLHVRQVETRPAYRILATVEPVTRAD